MSSMTFEPQDSSALATQYVTFRSGGLFFGIDVVEVQEVIKNQKMTTVPLASESVMGLINLRGQIITALNLRSLLQLETDTDESSDPMNVIVQTEEETVSLLVDSIGDVIEVDPGEFETPPETVELELRSKLHGVFKLEGDLLLVLNTKAFI